MWHHVTKNGRYRLGVSVQVSSYAANKKFTCVKSSWSLFVFEVHYFWITNRASQPCQRQYRIKGKCSVCDGSWLTYDDAACGERDIRNSLRKREIWTCVRSCAVAVNDRKTLTGGERGARPVKSQVAHALRSQGNVVENDELPPRWKTLLILASVKTLFATSRRELTMWQPNRQT